MLHWRPPHCSGLTLYLTVPALSPGHKAEPRYAATVSSTHHDSAMLDSTPRNASRSSSNEPTPDVTFHVRSAPPSARTRANRERPASIINCTVGTGNAKNPSTSSFDTKSASPSSEADQTAQPQSLPCCTSHTTITNSLSNNTVCYTETADKYRQCSASSGSTATTAAAAHFIYGLTPHHATTIIARAHHLGRTSSAELH